VPSHSVSTPGVSSTKTEMHGSDQQGFLLGPMVSTLANDTGGPSSILSHSAVFIWRTFPSDSGHSEAQWLKDEPSPRVNDVLYAKCKARLNQLDHCRILFVLVVPLLFRKEAYWGSTRRQA
jgi:hypothetical protein